MCGQLLGSGELWIHTGCIQWLLLNLVFWGCSRWCLQGDWVMLGISSWATHMQRQVLITETISAPHICLNLVMCKIFLMWLKALEFLLPFWWWQHRCAVLFISSLIYWGVLSFLKRDSCDTGDSSQCRPRFARPLGFADHKHGHTCSCCTDPAESSRTTSKLVWYVASDLELTVFIRWSDNTHKGCCI